MDTHLTSVSVSLWRWEGCRSPVDRDVLWSFASGGPVVPSGASERAGASHRAGSWRQARDVAGLSPHSTSGPAAGGLGSIFSFFSVKVKVIECKMSLFTEHCSVAFSTLPVLYDRHLCLVSRHSSPHGEPRLHQQVLPSPGTPCQCSGAMDVPVSAISYMSIVCGLRAWRLSLSIMP